MRDRVKGSRVDNGIMDRQPGWKSVDVHEDRQRNRGLLVVAVSIVLPIRGELHLTGADRLKFYCDAVEDADHDQRQPAERCHRH